MNFRIYWDGTCYDQLLDGSYQYNKGAGIDAVWDQASYANPTIQKWDGSAFKDVIKFNSTTYNNAQTANYTKATPCLQADLFGDWREELIMWNKNDSTEIMIFTTWTPTTYAVPTLMHDHTYRMGIAWQNTAYNQPPHLGYFLPDYINGKIDISGGVESLFTDERTPQQFFDLQGRRHEALKPGLNIIRQGGKVIKVIGK